MSYYNKPKQSDVVFDIETIVTELPIARIVDVAESESPKKKEKNPAWTIDKKHMISLAAGVIEEGEVRHIQSWAGDDLSVITNGFVNYLDSIGPFRLIGWNCEGFDLPEVLKCFQLTGVSTKHKIGKWDTVDLNYKPFKGFKLKDTARAFGLEVPDVDGSDVAELYARKDWESIKAYNESDVRLTGQLFIAASRLCAL